MNLNVNFWGVSALVGMLLLGRYMAKKEIEKTLGTHVSTAVEDKVDNIRLKLHAFLDEKFGEDYETNEEIVVDVLTVTNDEPATV